MIYVTSDLHFGHDKDFLYGPRGFCSIEDHDAGIIANWNSIIKEDDYVFILGDIMLGDNDAGVAKFNQLKGRKGIIFGNHDTMNRIKLYQSLSNVDIYDYATMLKYHKFSFYLSHFPTMIGNFDERTKLYNLCGHSHTRDKFTHIIHNSYHCELDAHNNYPVAIDTIIADIRKYKECNKNDFT